MGQKYRPTQTWWFLPKKEENKISFTFGQLRFWQKVVSARNKNNENNISDINYSDNDPNTWLSTGAVLSQNFADFS